MEIITNSEKITFISFTFIPFSGEISVKKIKQKTSFKEQQSISLWFNTLFYSLNTKPESPYTQFPLRHNSHSSKLAFCHNKTSNTIGIQPWDCISLLQYFPTDHKQNCTLDDRRRLPSTHAATGILPVGQYPLYFFRAEQETYCDRQSKQKPMSESVLQAGAFFFLRSILIYLGKLPNLKQDVEKRHIPSSRDCI